MGQKRCLLEAAAWSPQGTRAAAELSPPTIHFMRVSRVDPISVYSCIPIFQTESNDSRRLPEGTRLVNKTMCWRPNDGAIGRTLPDWLITLALSREAASHPLPQPPAADSLIPDVMPWGLH